MAVCKIKAGDVSVTGRIMQNGELFICPFKCNRSINIGASHRTEYLPGCLRVNLLPLIVQTFDANDDPPTSNRNSLTYPSYDVRTHEIDGSKADESEEKTLHRGLPMRL